MLNKIFLQGRLVADPELKQTPSGVPVASFRLAVDHDFKNKETGEKGVDFINCVAWRQTGEFISRYFSKGRMAIIEGRLQIRPFTDKEGNKRTAAEVVVDNAYFGDSKPADGSAPAGNYAPRAAAAPANYGTPAPGGDQFAELGDDDGELPF
ncbi:MAG: single-stranded DNA-binding protein [Oscillospiraceae bacterium]